MASRIFLVAGESSGDLHAAHLAQELRRIQPDLELLGLGGEGMRSAGVEILADPTRLAVIGIAEVLRHWPKFRQLYRNAVAALETQKPDLVVLVDYPGFNLRFAREVKRRGIRLVYYISPQIWAWDPGRIHLIRRRVDRMLVIFPFEKSLYEKANIPVTFTGHPLLDHVKPILSRSEALEKFGLADALPVIGLLPGSREGEIRRILPTLLGAAEQMRRDLPSSTRFLLIKAPHLSWNVYRAALARSSVQPKVIERWDYDSLFCCDLMLVTSGTATLECALLERPMLIVYKTSWVTYLLSRLLIRIPMIGLANIVAGRKVAPEFIQHRASPEAIAAAALRLWQSGEDRSRMKEELRRIQGLLGAPGAARRAAQAVLTELGR